MTHPKYQIHKHSSYVAWIRLKNCLVCAQHPVDCHHVYNSGKKNHGNDYLSVPLCRSHHQSYHQLEHTKFEQDFNLNLDWEIINLLSEFIDRDRLD